ncbi:MAG: type III-A CRISPR-associated RAMP protein Csm5 [Desulfosoma sp.]|uniref:type III-A CRISPR-associated RAMP protein Csm5 n=1 Tax=Desulfosoma sp. TaxID=2603217 RepID=UPI00404A8A55
MATQASALTKAQPVEKLTVHFNVLSPIHIGTREGALLPMEYLYHQGSIWVVDESKLGRFLLQRNLMDQFIQEAFSKNLKKHGLSGFFERHARNAPLNQLAPEVAAYSVPGGQPDMGEFRPFVRDGFGRVYIPGTSIKGVLRTAYLYAVLKNEASHTQSGPHPREREIEGRINGLKTERNRERAKKFLSAELQRNLLQSWDLACGGSEQNRDILRCLKVRDAYPLNDKVQTRVIPISFLSKRSDGTHYWSQKPRGGGDLTVWVEAVVGGTFVTEILWDQRLYEAFQRENPKKSLPFSRTPSPKEFLILAMKMNKDFLAHETAFFGSKGVSEAGLVRSWYEKTKEKTKGALFRIGFGSGMLSTTVNLLWSEKLRQEIRNVCGHDRGTEPAPKSRRVWVKSEKECVPMGWAEIRLADSATPDASKPSSPPAKASDHSVKTSPPSIVTAPSVTTTTPSKPKTATAAPSVASSLPPSSLKPTSPRGHVPEAKPSAPSDLVGQARSVQLTNRLAMERLLESMENAEEAQARQAARVLKERMERERLWKSTPFRTDIEAFLEED